MLVQMTVRNVIGLAESETDGNTDPTAAPKILLNPPFD